MKAVVRSRLLVVWAEALVTIDAVWRELDRVREAVRNPGPCAGDDSWIELDRLSDVCCRLEAVANDMLHPPVTCRLQLPAAAVTIDLTDGGAA